MPMNRAENPTARALLTLELIQNNPGITADRLGDRLGVSERAARRYVGTLREAGVPVESERGPYGGYRVGRGFRLPPLMFTAPEALGLVMAVLDSRHRAVDAVDPVGSALDKIVRALPESIAGQAEAVRRGSARGGEPDRGSPSPEITAVLAQACEARRRLRLRYRLGPGEPRVMEVDPWAVVVREGRWYLLCWSHTKAARRVLRVDRVAAVEALDGRSDPPADLDPVAVLDEHLAGGWRHRVEVVVGAPAAVVARRIPRSMGRCEEIEEGRTRLVGSTDALDWYAEQLATVGAPFRIVQPPELREAVEELGRRLLRAAESGTESGTGTGMESGTGAGTGSGTERAGPPEGDPAR